MPELFDVLQPPLVLSPLHFSLSQLQAELSAETGTPVMLTVTIGYDGCFSNVELFTPDGDYSFYQEGGLEEAIQRASAILVRMHKARLNDAERAAPEA